MHNAPDSQIPPSGSLADWEIALIEHVVDGFLSTRETFPGFERDDLVQESLLHWWSQRSRFSAKRGASLKTFLRRVVKAKLLDLERRERAAKRGGHSRALRLDAPASRDETNPATLGSLIPDSNPESSPEEVIDGRILRNRIDRISQLLTSPQRQIIAGIESGTSKSDLSRQLGIPRATLYDELHRIQKVFREEGLEEFLP